MSDIRTIVYDLLQRAGYSTDDNLDFDISKLSGKVEGMFATQQASVRSHLSQLVKVFFLQFVESDGLLVVRPIDDEVRATITEDDLIPIERNSGTDGNVLASEVIKVEKDLPNQVNVTYLDKSFDYQSNTQTARRITKNTDNITTVDFSLVLSSDQARQVADVLLYDAWLSRRQLTIRTSNKFQKLEVGDVLSLTYNGESGNWRITKVIRDVMEVELSLVPHDATTFVSKVKGAEVNGYVNSLRTIAQTKLFLLDIPKLTNNESGAGFYAVASKTTDDSSWPGASLFESKDAGQNFSNINSLNGPATYGVCDTVLNDSSGCNLWDNKNTLDVTLVTGTLESKTKLEVLNGSNAAMVGSELIQFKNATLIGTNQYRLDTLLRGRRGTEHLAVDHQSEEDFILLQPDSVIRISQSTDDLYKQRQYKGVSSGAIISEAESLDFTNQGASLKPYSVSHVKGSVSNGDWVVSWKRRTRINGGWVDNTEVPLSEVTELYDAEVVNVAGDVVRSFNNLTSESFTYTSSDQITDFGSNQSSIIVRIYQKSDTVGRGIKKEVTLT